MLITDRLRPKGYSVSIDSLLLKEAKGMTKKDKLVLFSLKNIYLTLMLLRMTDLGKKKSDRLCIEKGISFKNFLYKSVKFLGMDDLRLKVNVPKYGYQAYCRTEDDFNDFVIMTQHEHDLVKCFSPKKGDVVVDVGAHMGLYTMISSKHVGPYGKVIAIITDPQIFDMLNHNIKLNNITNVMPFNYIPYSKEMDMVLVRYSRMLLGKNGKPNTVNKTIAVHVNTLDNLLQHNRINEVNWIKIDVEGAELEVLKGAHNVLSNSKDIALLIEVHGKDNYKPLTEFLHSYNFILAFEKSYEWGAKHVIARKSSLLG
jgi:FkbM family methyltransferase